MTHHFMIGTAGWSIPKISADHFPEKGSHLERYSQCLNAVEINSSFYRDHKPETYQKWAKMVPKDFLFSVKLSKVYTHGLRLEDTTGLSEVIRGIQHLEEKLGVILIQLPPSLAFQEKSVTQFFKVMRKLYKGRLALEARNKTWTSKAAQNLLENQAVPNVIADPTLLALSKSAGQTDFQYYRLHGSPEIYKSNYAPEDLKIWITKLKEDTAETLWCIFDNTTFGHATENALAASRKLTGT